MHTHPPTHPLTHPFTHTQDACIVAEGWLSTVPGVNLIAGMKVLRLSRILRIFRAARGWPQLQSIVFALLAGVASAGWILVLMGVFNYIYGCIGVILFHEIDPFHFGRVGRAFVTLQSFELMNYNLMTFVNIKGCAEFPGAYVRVCAARSYHLKRLPSTPGIHGDS